MVYTIYLRTNKANGMQYVGQTKDFDRRERDWNCLKRTYANKFINDARKTYGLDAFETSIIAYVKTKEQANDLETMCIKALNTIYPNGYNLSLGRGLSGIKHSDVSKILMSEAKKGVKNPNYGNLNRIDISKPINQYDKEGNFIKKWPSLIEIQRELNISYQNVCRCCKHKPHCHTAGGYKWEYANE